MTPGGWAVSLSCICCQNFARWTTLCRHTRRPEAEAARPDLRPISLSGSSRLGSLTRSAKHSKSGDGSADLRRPVADIGATVAVATAFRALWCTSGRPDHSVILLGSVVKRVDYEF